MPYGYIVGSISVYVYMYAYPYAYIYTYPYPYVYIYPYACPSMHTPGGTWMYVASYHCRASLGEGQG